MGSGMVRRIYDANRIRTMGIRLVWRRYTDLAWNKSAYWLWLKSSTSALLHSLFLIATELNSLGERSRSLFDRIASMKRAAAPCPWTSIFIRVSKVLFSRIQPPLPFRGRGCSRGFAVHALRLRNELPLQGQFPEPKEFYGGERARETWIVVNKCPICNQEIRNLNNVCSRSNHPLPNPLPRNGRGGWIQLKS